MPASPMPHISTESPAVAAPPMVIDAWYLLLQIAVSSAVLYKGQKASSVHGNLDRAELFSGGVVRSWFLSILSFGMGLRIFCDVIILILPHRTPFLLSWFHYIPGLVLLSSYSLLIVFFSEIRRKTEGAVIPNQSTNSSSQVASPARRGLGYIALGYIAPTLIGCNLLLYIMFAIVGSLAHVRHAHREFRIAGSIFIGVIHLLLASAWAYNAGILVVQIFKRSECSNDLIRLDDPLIRSSGANSPLNSPSSSSYYLDSLRYMSEEIKHVKLRLCSIAVICPLIFAIGGYLEVFKGIYWTNTKIGNMNFFTQFSVDNFVIYAAEVLPAFICIASFSSYSQPSFSLEEKYVLSSISSSS